MVSLKSKGPCSADYADSTRLAAGKTNFTRFYKFLIRKINRLDGGAFREALTTDCGH